MTDAPPSDAQKNLVIFIIVLATCGFVREGFSSYDTFVLEGARFFAGLDGGITLMVKDL